MIKILIVFIFFSFSKNCFSQDYTMIINNDYFDKEYILYLKNKSNYLKENFPNKNQEFKQYLINKNEINIKITNKITDYQKLIKANKNFNEILKQQEKKSFFDLTKFEFEVFEIEYYGTKSFGLLIKNKKNKSINKKKSKLTIVANGEMNLSEVFSYNLELYEKILNNNSDLFLLYSFNNGLNSNHDIIFPISFDGKRSYLHRFSFFDNFSYANYFDVNYPDTKPYSVIISGPYYLVDAVLDYNNYDDVTIIGHSSGSFTANIISAFTNDIGKTFLINGVIPREFNFESLINAYKQFPYNSFYSSIDIWDLLFLNTLNNKKVFLMFNLNDHHNSQNSIFFEKIIQKLNITDLNIINFEGINSHQISQIELFKYIN